MRDKPSFNVGDELVGPVRAITAQRIEWYDSAMLSAATNELRRVGSNIHTDSTNLKYGIFILGWVAGRAADDVEDRNDAWRRALLRYNGCVRGTNTPDCKSYPDVVRREVQRSARSTCRGADFNRCVVEPMWLARRDAERADTASQGR